LPSCQGRAANAQADIRTTLPTARKKMAVPLLHFGLTHPFQINSSVSTEKIPLFDRALGLELKKYRNRTVSWEGCYRAQQA